MRNDKKSRAVIKAISGIMLILMLCIGSSGVKASAGGDDTAPTPVPTPTVSSQDITPTPTVSSQDITPSPTEEDEQNVAEEMPTPTPEPEKEDKDADEAEVIAAYTPTPTPYQIKEAEVTLAFKTAIYTGENIIQKVESVTWGNVLLIENKDYIVTEGLIRKEIGDYKVTVVGVGEYGGTTYAEWSIVAPTPTPEPTATPTPTPEDPIDPPTLGPVEPTPIPEKGFKVLGVEGKLYTGQAIVQEDVRVMYDGRQLALKKDYTISYKNNVNAGVASVIIKGKGSYKGKCKVDFTIDPIPLEEYCEVQDLVVSVKASNANKTPDVRWGDTYLKRIRDFDMSMQPSEMKTPGVYKVLITGTGNFTGSIPITVTVMEGTDVKNLRVSKIKEQEWTGFAVTPLVTITYRGENVTRGIDITYEDNIDTGKGYLVITANGEEFKDGICFAGSAKVPFRIKGRNIADASFKSQGVVYTGHPVTTEVTVKMHGEELQEGKDYTISFRNNREVGTAEYVVKGCGGYSGKFVGAYTIHPCSLKDEYIDVELPERVYYEKGGAAPVPVIKHNNIVLRRFHDYDLEYSESRSAGKLFTITVTGMGNYRGTLTREVMCYMKPISMVIDMTPDPVWKKNTRISRYIKSPVLKDTNGVTLEAGVDYETDFTYTDEFGDPLELTDYMPMGKTICIHIEGKGNYSGTTVIEYKAAASKISKVKFKVEPQVYTGYPVEPGQDQVTTSIESGQYEILYYMKNTKTGTATMVVHGLGEYGGYKKVKFKIVKYTMK